MKFLLIFIIFSSSLVVSWTESVKCESEGCYEVIKFFADLLEKKIHAIDAVSKKITFRLTQIC